MDKRVTSFRFVSYRVDFTATEKVLLAPIPEVSFRGGFGYVFKQIVCLDKKGDCSTCLLQSYCPYYQIFESPAKEGKIYTQKYSFLPHPFVMRFPEEQPSVVGAGESFSVEFNLLGNANSFFPYLVTCFQRLGEMGLGKSRGKCTLENIHTVDGKGKPGALVYSSRTNRLMAEKDSSVSILIDEEEIIRSFSEGNSQLEIEFVSPLRIKHNGTYRHNLSFDILVKGMLRRISSLLDIYLNGSLSRSFSEYLLEMAGKVKTVRRDIAWQEIERYSKRKDTSMRLGGYVGRIVYEGRVSSYVTLLEIARAWHIGKASSFGFGRINYKLR